MNVPLSDNEWIEMYLLGKLTNGESRDFLLRVEDDREFARKFRLIKMFPEMMSEAGRKELEKKQAEALIHQEVKKKSSRFPKRWIITLAAVSVIIFIVISLLFIFSGSSHQKKNVESKNVVPQKTVITKPSANPVIANNSGTPAIGIPPVTRIIVGPPVTPARDTIVKTIQKTPQPEEKTVRQASVGITHKAIELLKPVDGVKFSRKEALMFTWAMKTDTFTRFYIVSEDREKVVLWRGIRPGVREYKVPGNYLYPGKFYWYVGIKEIKRSFIISMPSNGEY